MSTINPELKIDQVVGIIETTLEKHYRNQRGFRINMPLYVPKGK